MKDNSLDLRPDCTSDIMIANLVLLQQNTKVIEVTMLDKQTFIWSLLPKFGLNNLANLCILNCLYYDTDYVFMPTHCMWTSADHPDEVDPLEKSAVPKDVLASSFNRNIRSVKITDYKFTSHDTALWMRLAKEGRWVSIRWKVASHYSDDADVLASSLNKDIRSVRSPITNSHHMIQRFEC